MTIHAGNGKETNRARQVCTSASLPGESLTCKDGPSGLFMRRSLRSFDVLCLGLNAIVGSGIFLLPDDLYREMGALSPLAFLLCGLGVLPVALCYAALARDVDETGGPYVYASRAFGPRVGFVIGWTSYANALFSFAAVSAASAAYALRLFPGVEFPGAPVALAALAVIAFSALNYRGARPGARAVDTFTIAKFAVLFVLVAVLLPHWEAPRPTEGWLPGGLSGIGTATFVALFAVQGFEVVGVPAGESENPRRDVPWAVVGSLLFASLVYVGVQTVLVGAVPDLGRVSDTPLVDAALGVAPALGVLIACGGLISNLGFISGTALGSPRYLFAMSRGGHFPARLSAVHPRFHSPHRAILVTASLVIGLVLFLDYRALIGISNVSVALQYLAICLAVVRLSTSATGAKVRMPGGLVIPLLGVAVSLWIFTEASLVELGWAAAALGLGLVLARLAPQR